MVRRYSGMTIATNEKVYFHKRIFMLINRTMILLQYGFYFIERQYVFICTHPWSTSDMCALPETKDCFTNK